MNVLVQGNAGLLPEFSISNRSGGGSSLGMHGTLLLVCHSSYGPTINSRLLTDRKNYTCWFVTVSGKAYALINASDSVHDFSVKLSLFMCSHSSCLLRLAPTMFYIF